MADHDDLTSISGRLTAVYYINIRKSSAKKKKWSNYRVITTENRWSSSIRNDYLKYFILHARTLYNFYLLLIIIKRLRSYCRRQYDIITDGEL